MKVKQKYIQKNYILHKKGFKIFLPPEKITICDEYSESDPYNVEQNITSDFHQRRILTTIELIRYVNCHHNENLQILDLGCGQGHITEKMRQVVLNAEFSGLDYSISSITYAHEHFPFIDFTVGDGHECPYSDGFFNIVVCNNLWEHVPDPMSLLNEIKRILKSNGYLILSTPSRYRLENLINIIKGKKINFMSMNHVTEYSVGQVLEQLKYGNFYVEMILSRPLARESLLEKVTRKLLMTFFYYGGSHHQIESTVFFLAKKGDCNKLLSYPKNLF